MYICPITIARHYRLRWCLRLNGDRAVTKFEWDRRIKQTATHCNTLQHTATHCNKLQQTATHCITLHHTAKIVGSNRPTDLYTCIFWLTLLLSLRKKSSISFATSSVCSKFIIENEGIAELHHNHVTRTVNLKTFLNIYHSCLNLLIVIWPIYCYFVQISQNYLSF